MLGADDAERYFLTESSRTFLISLFSKRATRFGEGVNEPIRESGRMSGWKPPMWAFLAFAWGLTGCGASGPDQLRVAVEADSAANDNSAVSLAVLVVYDDAEMAELRRKSAREWFAEAEQRQRDNPDGNKFDLVTWELMPGQRIRERTIELKGEPAEGLVFADYYGDGQHREAFNPARRIQIQLLKDRFHIVYRSEDYEEDSKD